MLNRRDGRQCAARIGAEFPLLNPAGRVGPVDHDWVYRHPVLFVSMLQRLGLAARRDDAAAEGSTDDVIDGTAGA